MKAETRKAPTRAVRKKAGTSIPTARVHDALFYIRHCLERADLFFDMLNYVDARKGRWTHVRTLALVDAGVSALDEAIREMDSFLRTLA